LKYYQVIAAGIDVLQELQAKFGFKLDYTHLPWSTELYKQTGRYMPANSLEILKQHDAYVVAVYMI
jgi:tartrate dehydrogenase/decarboxylase / D-malate dehydrogenase